MNNGAFVSKPLRSGLIVVPASTMVAQPHSWDEARRAMLAVDVRQIPASMRVAVGLQAFLNGWLLAAEDLTHVPVPIAEAPEKYRPHAFQMIQAEGVQHLCGVCSKREEDLIHLSSIVRP